MKNRKTVLVTAIGSFSALAVINSLKKHKYRIIGCDINKKELIACSIFVDQYYQSPKYNEGNKYIDFVYEVCIKEAVDYIFPLTDAEIDVLNTNRYQFEKNDIKLCISSKETVNICRNKLLTYEYLKSKKVKNLIKTQSLNKVDIKNIKYPVIIKPKDGRSSNGFMIIKNNSELKNALKTIDSDKYIIQRKINGNIITVDICRDNFGTITSIPREEFIRTHNGAGLSIKIIKDKEIINFCENIANHLNIKGTVNFELMKTKNGKLYFLECNPRFSGGIAFSQNAGYDFVYNGLRCFDNKKIQVMKDYNEMYIVKQYYEIITHNYSG